LTFIIGVTLAFVFLDWPLRIVVIVVLGAIEAFEIVLWMRLRRKRSMTGAEGIVGARGRAITDCDPDGQVRVKGAIWKAHSPSGATAGDAVVVTATEGIRLKVQRA
jgi:membrane-bound serine protease (ClpP class)